MPGRHAQQATLESAPTRHADAAAQSTSRHTSSQSQQGHAEGPNTATVLDPASRQVEAQKYQHQGKTGLVVGLDGKMVFVEAKHWQKTQFHGRDALYCQLENIFALV
jgi:ribosomal protein L21E